MIGQYQGVPSHASRKSPRAVDLHGLDPPLAGDRRDVARNEADAGVVGDHQVAGRDPNLPDLHAGRPANRLTPMVIGMLVLGRNGKNFDSGQLLRA